MTWNGTSAVFTGSTGTDYDALGGVAVVFEAKTAIPEPATWAMLAIGFVGLGFAGYRKTKGAARFAA